LVSDARRNVRLYSRIKDRKSPLKGSQPSVPHGTNFLIMFKLFCIMLWLFAAIKDVCVMVMCRHVSY